MFPEANRHVGVIDVTTIGDHLERATLNAPDTEAVVFPAERVTYRELRDRVDVLAKGLLANGVRPGDKVGILLPSNIDALAWFLAATRIGAVAVPVNARFKARELRFVLRQSDMRVLVTDSRLATFSEVFAAIPGLDGDDPTAAIAVTAPELATIIVYGDDVPDAATSGASVEVAGIEIDDDELLDRRQSVSVADIAAIVYTSGTTADPKGVMLTHESLVRVAMMVARTRLRLTSEDRVWSVLPFFHIGGINFALSCFDAAATYCHAGDFRPDTALRQIVDERCTVALAGFETIWIPVLTQPDFDDADLSALRIQFCLGIPERMREMQDRIPHAPLISTYGSTETASFFTLADPNDTDEARMHTSGQLLPGLRAKLVDPETGREVGPGEVGEVLCGGWSRFVGYYNDAQATAEAIDSDGWFRSGDLGTMDDQGRVSFVSRVKDMLKVGGENVAAADVEGYLIRHPAVVMAQVVSAPDSRYSEVPAAFVQLVPDAAVTEQELIEYCLGEIATFKVPRYVRFVDEWPMSGTKIKKHVLRDRIAQELQDAGITAAPGLSSKPM